MDADIRAHDRHYRRGLVLGTTMAEIMILIIFILLLAFAWALRLQFKHIQELEGQVRELTEELNVATRDAGPTGGESIQDILKEYVRQKSQIKELAQKLQEADAVKDQLKQYDKIQKITEQLGIKGAPQPDELKKLEDRLSAGDKVLAALDQLPPGSLTKTPDDVAKALPKLDQIAKADSVAKENADLKGMVSNLRAKLGAGRGADYPPCWANERGQIQYIFNMSLMDNGTIQVHDNAIPERAADQAKLPLQYVRYDSPMDPTEFNHVLLPLFNYSQQHDPQCRFFVRVYDQTSDSNKLTYKASLRTVERFFYKLAMYGPHDDQQ